MPCHAKTVSEMCQYSGLSLRLLFSLNHHHCHVFLSLLSVRHAPISSLTDFTRRSPSLVKHRKYTLVFIFVCRESALYRRWFNMLFIITYLPSFLPLLLPVTLFHILSFFLIPPLHSIIKPLVFFLLRQSSLFLLHFTSFFFSSSLLP